MRLLALIGLIAIAVGVAALVFFFGGWLSPFQSDIWSWMPEFLRGGNAFMGLVWFFLKVSFFLFLYLWFRATFPRYRYDQIMRLGWKIFIPVTLVWIVVEAVLMIYKVGPWSVAGS